MSRHPFTELVDEEYIMSLPSVTTDFTMDKLKEKYFRGSVLPKHVARKWDFPVNHPIRRELWPFLCEKYFGKSIFSALESPNSIPEDETDMPSPSESENIDIGRELADIRLLPTYHLNERGRKVLVALLRDIARFRPMSHYAPHLWPLCAILLHYLRPSVISECIEMIFRAKDFRLSDEAKLWRSRCLILSQLITSNGALNLPFKAANGSIVRALEVKGGGLDPIAKRREMKFRLDESSCWMIAVFILPFEVVVPMIDNFITEGFKVLLRMGFVIWKEVMLNRQKNLKAIVKSGGKPLPTDNSDFKEDNCFFLNEVSKYSPEEARGLLEKAFKIRQLSRSRIASAIESVVEEVDHPAADTPLPDDLVKPCIIPRCKRINKHSHAFHPDFRPVINDFPRPNVSKLVNDEEMDFIRSLIRNPMIRECMKDELIYTSSEHGYSMQTLLNRIRAHQAKINRPDHILIMSTLSGKSLFGAYITSPWDSSNRFYYGDPMTVLFRLRPGEMVAYPYLGSEEKRFQLFRDGYMGIGGGIDGGPCAIYFDKNMEYGHSGPSPTFNSKCLVIAPEDQINLKHVEGRDDLEFCIFKIGKIEVISFVDEIDWEATEKRLKSSSKR